MCNSLFLGDKTIPKAKDGEEFDLRVKGVYHTEDGVRKLDVIEVDGDKVGEMGDCGCGEDHEDMMEQDADDALRIFFIKAKKG